MSCTTLRWSSSNIFNIPIGADNTINGEYRLPLGPLYGNLTVHLKPEGVTEGIMDLSVDGEYGENSQVDLTETRILNTNFKAAFIDLEITGVNPGGTLTVYVK